MTRLARDALAALGVGLGVISGVLPAAAGSDDGNFQVRVLATVVDPETDATVRAGGAVIPGADADVSTEVIPALTLGYYLNQNLALELFCCFAKHEIDGKGTIANLGEIADTWIFPPALTLQYHFTGMGKFEPYVGAGVQYIIFFDTGTGDNALGATKIDIDPACGFTLQAGFDISLGNGWSLNADVKKTWLDTTTLGTTTPRSAVSTSWAMPISIPGSSRPALAIASTLARFSPSRASRPDKVNNNFVGGREGPAMRRRALLAALALADA